MDEKCHAAQLTKILRAGNTLQLQPHMSRVGETSLSNCYRNSFQKTRSFGTWQGAEQSCLFSELARSEAAARGVTWVKLAAVWECYRNTALEAGKELCDLAKR